MFEYSNQKRDPIQIIFWCGGIPFIVFWLFHRHSIIAAFAVQVYVVSAAVFLFYPFTIQPQNVRQKWFWKLLLQAGIMPHLLFLTGLWYFDVTYPNFTTTPGTVIFMAFVLGVIEMFVVSMIMDRLHPDDHSQQAG